ncbi:MAG: AMP-binding protein, partial [Deltaproteobacteria bacterium]|nr:AMP-binding protein [Deltaproteobacteria bacterium]
MNGDREKRIQEYIEKGFWTRDLTADFWDHNAEKFSEETAIVDSKTRLTWSQAKQQIDRIAMGLLERGVNKGDVMLVQMFNSVDLVLIRLACEKAGIFLAVVAPTFRQAELQFVLNKVEAKGVFIPYDFRGLDYYGMFEELRPRIPSLEHIFVTGEEVPRGSISFQAMKEEPLEETHPKDFLDAFKFSAFGFEEIMTTSGSTGIPKCVQWPDCARLAHARVGIER